MRALCWHGMIARRLILAAALLCAAGAGPPGPTLAAGGGTGLPMRESADGPTLDEHRQRQAELMTRLLGALPARALDAPLRIEPTREEIRGVTRRAAVSGVPLRIGVVKSILGRLDVFGLDAARRGAGGPARDGGYEWAVAVASSGAGAMRFHVERLELPPGTALFLYTRQGEAFGPYTGNGPQDDGEFWTDTVYGGEAILQVHVPPPATPDDLAQVAFSVTEAGIILPRYAGGSAAAPAPAAGVAPLAPSGPFPCGSPSCLVDATCGTPSPATLARNAVAKMEWPLGRYLYTCSGALINDANPDRGNFFLTAAHCIDRNHAATNIQFYWRFATLSCNGNCPDNAGWPFKTAGATIAATGRRGDYTLLQLRTPPPAGSVFLGWSAEPVSGSSGLPLYRISNPGFGPQVYSRHAVDPSAPMCGGWPRGFWIYSRDIVGAIDGGSSGSPVVNAQAQIVGQLSGSCGADVADVCGAGPGEPNATVDGAFAAYFPRLQAILAP